MLARQVYRASPRIVPRAQLVSGPLCLPIGGNELSANRGLWSNPSDAEVRSRVKSATDQVERYLGRSIVARIYDVLIDDLANPEYIEIPKRPVLNVVSLSTRNTDGTYTLQSADTYWLSEARDPARVTPVYGTTWPLGGGWFWGGTRLEAMKLRIVSGYVYPFKVRQPDTNAGEVYDGTLWSPNHALMEGQLVRVSRGLNDQSPDQLFEDTDYIVVNVEPHKFQLVDFEGNLVVSTDQQQNWSFIGGDIPENIRRALIIAASHAVEVQTMGDKPARYHATTLPEEAVELLKYDRVIAI
jgi:hypothetical protein